ncbi:MAG: UDP-N-acetylenolpyruvoylglucosamine reductase [Bacteroidetes bacterium ADurb.BinA174]|nr:MAG: UDP-N-acetylenolpyruvoylglucosamine reductase [Bacteroidetes bacterium ADurb.BinA174]
MNIQQNIQLQPYNSFRTKAIAKLFAQPETVDELQELLQTYANEPKFILGGGFNIFFTQDFNGLVINPAMRGIRTISENTDFVEIEAGAAEDWDNFVAYCVSHRYSGVENLSLIPGTVGAAPIQNIGAYGAEVKDVIVKVIAVEIESGKMVEFSNAECEFEYRNSIFKRTRKHIITHVVFRLSKSFEYKEKYVDLNHELKNITTPNLSQVREAIIRIRTRKLPDYNSLPNAGSFFKNPILTKEEKEKLLTLLPDAPVYNAKEDGYKTSAAYLIEKAGFKGKRKGDVGTYEHHALIIVNYGTESGQEIVNFMHDIQNSVFQQYGVSLEPEVWIF